MHTNMSRSGLWDGSKTEFGTDTEVITETETEIGTDSVTDVEADRNGDGADADALPVKKKRNYPKNRRSSPRPTRSIQAPDELVQKVSAHNMELFMLEPVDLMKGEEVAQRSTEYFEICRHNEMRPTVAGYALAMGVDRDILARIRNGAEDYGNSKYNLTRLIIKRAMSLLNSSIEDFLQNDSKSTIASLFLLKNHFGYQDRSETVVTHDAGQDQKSLEDIRKRYIIDDTE